MVEPADAGAPATVAINNALNEVVHGLDLSAEDWRRLGATRTEDGSAYAEWATSQGWDSTGLRYTCQPSNESLQLTGDLRDCGGCAAALIWLACS